MSDQPLSFPVVARPNGQEAARSVTDQPAGPFPELQRKGGPPTALAAKPEVGFTSKEAFPIHVQAGRGTHRFSIPCELIGRTVGTGEELQWAVFPEAVKSFERLWDSTAAAVDVQFDDGTWLSDLDVADQYGGRISAREQYKAKRLWVDQWNRRGVALRPAAGKIVSQVVATVEASPWADLDVYFDAVNIQPEPAERSNPLDFVVTTRGTHSSDRFSRGNTAPLVAVPHGGVFGLPMTDASRGNWPYAYHAHNRDSDNRPAIQAFATSHIPSPWMGDRGVFQVMPSPLADPDTDRLSRALGFLHTDEHCGPHLYAVTLEGGITAQLTAGDFAMGMRFAFPAETASIIFDHHGLIRDVRVYRSGDDTVIEALLDDREETPPHYIHVRTPHVIADCLSYGEGRLSGYLTVKSGTDGRVDVMLGISTMGFTQAEANLRKAGDFETMLAETRRRWEEKLGILTLVGASTDQLISLYSGLYRLFLYPNRAGEPSEDGQLRYRSPYGKVLTNPIRACSGPEIMTGQLSTTNGFWDTYRTAWPLLGLLTPEDAGELAQGFVQHFLDGGWTPRWSAPGAEDMMTGTTSDTVFADLLVKNTPGLDLNTAYRTAVKNATVPANDSRVGRKGLSQGRFCGYIDTDTPEGLSWTLDNAINDWGAAQMARILLNSVPSTSVEGRRYWAEWEYFARRSLAYKLVFDRERKFFIGRRRDGSWRADQGFDPAEWGHDYTETNAWGTAFTVPHDGLGLTELHGGEHELGAALDRFFDTPETGDISKSGSYGFVIHEMTEARDVRMGMLGLSNQPAHHIPYMYMFAGRHDDAHRLVHEALTRLFVGSDIGQGYPGDEDNGEMSAWYVFAALGLYPLVPASGTYVLLPPTVERAEIRPPGGKTTVIEVVNPEEVGIYIRSVHLNGALWEEISIPHDVLAAGAHIQFELSQEPCGWAANSRPASASGQHGFTVPLTDATGPGRGYAIPDTAAVLFDNIGKTSVTLSEGECVEYRFNEPTTVELYTVTTTAAGSVGWRLEVETISGEVLEIDMREGEYFDWAGQTRPFAPVGKSALISAVRVLPIGENALIQLEFFPGHP